MFLGGATSSVPDFDNQFDAYHNFQEGAAAVSCGYGVGLEFSSSDSSISGLYETDVSGCAPGNFYIS